MVGSKRYCKANNPYLEDYDENKETNYIMYWDANSLYGGAMSKTLPYADFKFIEINEDDYYNILNTPDDNEEGYILTVDLEFPHEIHDKLKEYVPAPESCTAKTDWLSEYQIELGLEQGVLKLNEKKQEKLKTVK